MPAPCGNCNRLTTGYRTERHGMVLATLGDRYSGIYQDLKKLRRDLEVYLPDSKGPDRLTAVAVINEAMRWEMTARVAQRLIADNAGLPPEQVIIHLNTATNATRNRNAAIARLLKDGKATDQGDLWATLDRQKATEESHTSTANNAPGDAVGDVAACSEAQGDDA